MKMLEFLEDQRQIDSDWHFDQARRWLDYDKGRRLDNVLIYSAFELRCGIERYLFEICPLVKGSELSNDEIRKCRSKRGTLELINILEPNYRKRVEFTNIVAPYVPVPKVVVVDIKQCINMIDELSEYCHKQVLIDESFGSKDRIFQKKGFKLVLYVDNYFRKLRKEIIRGIMDPNSMQPEMKKIYDDFISGAKNISETETSIKIMTPILIKRFAQNIGKYGR